MAGATAIRTALLGLLVYFVPLAFLGKTNGRSGAHLVATAAAFGLLSAGALATLGFTPVGP